MIQEVFTLESRSSHTLIVPFTADGIYGMIQQSANGTLGADWTTAIVNIMNSTIVNINSNYQQQHYFQSCRL